MRSVMRPTAGPGRGAREVGPAARLGLRGVIVALGLATAALVGPATAAAAAASAKNADITAPTVVSVTYSSPSVTASRSSLMSVSIRAVDTQSGFGRGVDHGAGIAFGFLSDRGAHGTTSQEVTLGQPDGRFVCWWGSRSVDPATSGKLPIDCNDPPSRLDSLCWWPSGAVLPPACLASRPRSLAVPTVGLATGIVVGDRVALAYVAPGMVFWECSDHALYEPLLTTRCRDSVTVNRVTAGRITDATFTTWFMVPRFSKRGRWFFHCGEPNINDLAGNRRLYYVEERCKVPPSGTKWPRTSPTTGDAAYDDLLRPYFRVT